MPADPELVWSEAETHLQAGRFGLASAGLRRLETLRQPTAKDWVLRAQIANALGHDDAALEALKFVDDSDQLASQVHYMAGRIERKHNRVRLAEAQYRRAVELDPQNAAAHRELIYIYGTQLRRRELDSEFKALGKLTALTHHDMFTWGLTHFTTWGPDNTEDLQAFVDADPLDRESRLSLASLLMSQVGMAERIEKVLVPLAPDDPDAAALRIELKLNAGDIEGATALLREAPKEGAVWQASADESPCAGAISRARPGTSKPRFRMNRGTASRSGSSVKPCGWAVTRSLPSGISTD